MGRLRRGRGGAGRRSAFQLALLALGLVGLVGAAGRTASADASADAYGLQLQWKGSTAPVPDAGPPPDAGAKAAALAPAGPAGPAAPAVPGPKVTPPGPRAVPTLPQGGRVVIIDIDGVIDLGLSPFVERVLEDLGASDVLILDINTLGGRVDAAIVIRDALLRSKAKTVAWINPRAISAGALISLACDVIVVSPGATIGAATPIQMGQDGAKPVEEKVVSYMRKEMRSTAEAKGRNGDIAEAMVDADITVPGLDEVPGKLVTLDGKAALAWAIAEFEAADEPALFAGLKIQPAKIDRPSISWAERIGRFLSDPTVSGLLMSLGMLGIMLELYSPGHGVALGVGLGCLALFFFGHHVVRLAGLEEILLFLFGASLLAYEIAVPGHLLPGIAGVLLILAALVLALVNLEHVPIEVSWRAGWIMDAIVNVCGSILLTAVALLALVKFIPRVAVARPLFLATAITARAQDPAEAALLASLVGQVGVALTDLRPAGKASFGEQRVDVVLESGTIDAGASLRGVRVDRSQLVVRTEVA